MASSKVPSNRHIALALFPFLQGNVRPILRRTSLVGTDARETLDASLVPRWNLLENKDGTFTQWQPACTRRACPVSVTSPSYCN
jgi:hypothetical protein